MYKQWGKIYNQHKYNRIIGEFSYLSFLYELILRLWLCVYNTYLLYVCDDDTKPVEQITLNNPNSHIRAPRQTEKNRQKNKHNNIKNWHASVWRGIVVFVCDLCCCYCCCYCVSLLPVLSLLLVRVVFPFFYFYSLWCSDVVLCWFVALSVSLKLNGKIIIIKMLVAFVPFSVHFTHFYWAEPKTLNNRFKSVSQWSRIDFSSS